MQFRYQHTSEHVGLGTKLALSLSSFGPVYTVLLQSRVTEGATVSWGSDVDIMTESLRVSYGCHKILKSTSLDCSKIHRDGLGKKRLWESPSDSHIFSYLNRHYISYCNPKRLTLGSCDNRKKLLNFLS